MDDFERIKLIDDEHLRLLSLGYLIDGCLTIAFSCLFIIHFAIFNYFTSNPQIFDDSMSQINNAMPFDFFRIIAMVLGFIIVLGILFGVAKIFSSRFIKRRKYRMFSYIIGIPDLLYVPFGTVMGISTIIVLGRQSVKDQYLENIY